MTDTLKPCPFCGSDDVSDAGYIFSGDKENPTDTGYFCNCVKCGAKNGGVMGFETKAEAVRRWNTRPANTDPMTIAKYDDDLRKAAGVWRDMESAPRDHTRILLYVPPYGVSCGHFDCVWENGIERWIMHSVLNKDAQPTAWMPLPEAPNGGSGR
ncbi:Lar family restriction alleviation protein [uncultured Ruegeria sp.]|uniref:Lar family restriction alleviation protein n=1 Tax=uncultured Ruegeria sp. TaxID=259304 RepID=UPI0026242CAF|nr:Lar family restriction alleviation protein [uncultured Ruegeria sp.]